MHLAKRNLFNTTLYEVWCSVLNRRVEDYRGIRSWQSVLKTSDGYFFSPHGLTALVGLVRIFWGFEITLIHTTLDKTSLDKLSVRRRDLYVTHNIHAHDSAGIWTRSSSNEASADPSRRPCDHRDRTSEGLVTVISKPLLQLLYLWNVLFKKFKRRSLNDSSVTTLV